MQLRVDCPPVISYGTTKMCHKSGDRYVCVCGFDVFVGVGWGTKHLNVTVRSLLLVVVVVVVCVCARAPLC